MSQACVRSAIQRTRVREPRRASVHGGETVSGVGPPAHRFPIRPLDRGAIHDYVTGLRSLRDPTPVLGWPFLPCRGIGYWR